MLSSILLVLEHERKQIHTYKLLIYPKEQMCGIYLYNASPKFLTGRTAGQLEAAFSLELKLVHVNLSFPLKGYLL